MKVKKEQLKQSATPIRVADCYVDDGYVQGPGGQLPDVDSDFQTDRRQDVKAYIQLTYNLTGNQRVFTSA